MQYSVQPIIFPVAIKQENAYEKLLLEIESLKKEVVDLKDAKAKRKRRTQEEIEMCEEEYNPLKSNGIQKPRKGDSIKSYDEFLAMQNYYLERGKIRDYALWTIGVSTALRISDLTKLKIGWLLNKDLSFKEYIDLHEKKTSKRNKVLITESIKCALTKLLESTCQKFSLNDYVFQSQKKGKLREESGWRIIADAAKALGFKTVINAHSMRHSFTRIAYCLGEASFDPCRMESLRIIMNHKDINVTARYAGVYDDICDDDRKVVSDFVLGKSGINELNLFKKPSEEK